MEWFDWRFGIASGYLNHMLLVVRLLGRLAARSFCGIHPHLLLLFYLADLIACRISHGNRVGVPGARFDGCSPADTVLVLVSLKFQSVQSGTGVFLPWLVIGAGSLGLGSFPITRRPERGFIVLITLGSGFMGPRCRSGIRETILSILWLSGGRCYWRLGVASEVVFLRLGFADRTAGGRAAGGFRLWCS